MKRNKLSLPAIFIGIFFFSSCYSIRVATTMGQAEPDPTNYADGFYRLKKVQVIDTVLKLKLLENDAMFLQNCSSNGIYSLEYRVTLGDVLLNGITFGKHRKVRVKMICLKESN
ncbi:hypothetical protein F0919_09310 [Taibaiella lutea]|uniref:Lipoprotein n=1 Tax=Taibaiella lutea TaxID=2608001 RepID=A0A5M6CIF0_9BACT|nr:hypothetical protein [Taibaiella lutea]KAA5534796.1 hypothetical protein F0919_09310 [Taibaiella lutea]